jgi:hypothetical protein
MPTCSKLALAVAPLLCGVFLCIECPAQDQRPATREPDAVTVAITIASSKRVAKDERPTKASDNAVKAYRSLLKLPGTGITKMVSTACGNALHLAVISADPRCDNAVLGGGNPFSFRVRNYTTADIADLKIRDGLFISGGKFVVGTLTDLGEVALEEVGTSTNGAAQLYKFVPASELSAAREQLSTINRGYADGDYKYAAIARIFPGHSYVLRSVAYRLTASGTDDKRDDVLIALKVIGLDASGDVTIVWRELNRIDAPTLDLTR